MVNLNFSDASKSVADKQRATFEDLHKAQVYYSGRPGYPVEVFDFLKTLGVNNNSTIADMGCGSGQLTKDLIPFGCQIKAVDKSKSMLDICEQELSFYPNIEFINRDMMDTGLERGAIDFALYGMCIHWAMKENPGNTLRELARILKSDGIAMIFWNDILASDEDCAYTDSFREASQTNTKEEHYDGYWKASGFKHKCLNNKQAQDFDRFFAMMRSKSGVPSKETDARYAEFESMTLETFSTKYKKEYGEKYDAEKNKSVTITLNLKTDMYWGNRTLVVNMLEKMLVS